MASVTNPDLERVRAALAAQRSSRAVLADADSSQGAAGSGSPSATAQPSADTGAHLQSGGAVDASLQQSATIGTERPDVSTAEPSSTDAVVPRSRSHNRRGAPPLPDGLSAAAAVAEAGADAFILERQGSAKRHLKEAYASFGVTPPEEGQAATAADASASAAAGAGSVPVTMTPRTAGMLAYYVGGVAPAQTTNAAAILAQTAGQSNVEAAAYAAYGAADADGATTPLGVPREQDVLAHLPESQNNGIRVRRLSGFADANHVAEADSARSAVIGTSNNIQRYGKEHKPGGRYDQWREFLMPGGKYYTDGSKKETTGRKL